MKKSDLIKLIQECYSEIILEDDATLDAAKQREKTEKEQYLQAKKAATDAEINDLRQDKLSETELEEMARIPTLYSLSPDVNPEEYTGTIKQIAQYLKDNPGKTKLEIAQGIGKNAQQAVNMIVKAMEEKGILDSQGLRSEPKYQKSDGLGTGLRGRKLSPAGAKKRAIQSVYNKLMAGLDDEITYEEDELIGDEDMNKIKELVSQGGIKRGRKPKEEEPEMYYQNDDDLEIPNNDFEDNIDLEPEEYELNGDDEIETEDELTNLINKKDELLSQLKRKEIDLETYKELVGDIPQRIKQLQQDEEIEDNIDPIMERMQYIANIKRK